MRSYLLGLLPVYEQVRTGESCSLSGSSLQADSRTHDLESQTSSPPLGKVMIGVVPVSSASD